MDLLYEVTNDDLQLRPGQPVSVAIPTSYATESLVIPTSALLWDGMGNAWVYVRESAAVFRRQRVQVGPYQQDMVSIERGLEKDQEIVVVGAETLHGEEFKSQIAVEDDD